MRLFEPMGTVRSRTAETGGLWSERALGDAAADLEAVAWLAECCFFQGEPVFSDETEVLAGLTGRQMEELLGRLAGYGPASRPVDVNPAFDQERFDALREG